MRCNRKNILGENIEIVRIVASVIEMGAGRGTLSWDLELAFWTR